MLLLQDNGVCLISSSWGEHRVFCKGFHGSGIEEGRSMWHGLDGYSRLLLSESARSREPGVGLIQQGANRRVPALPMAPGAFPGLVLQ